VHTLEVLLPKVEAIGVDQTIGGRLLGYGTLRIVGTGGTVEEFARVACPQALREAVVRQDPRSSAARVR
jgi:Bacterial PH domain